MFSNLGIGFDMQEVTDLQPMATCRLVGIIINNATFENVRTTAIVLMEKKAKGLKKLELRRDIWGCKGRKVRKVYIP
jgi:hypothetical protein